MQRTITYYYPDGERPSAMKVYQDRSSQIRGYVFKRQYLSKIAKEEYATNYAVYFLFGDINPNGQREVYIGQSKLGVNRINNHIRSKKFWSHCIMFVTDNNIFDTNAIDYMEYYFINMLINSHQYILTNVDKRVNEPNLNDFDKITYQTYLSQILFLLSAEGVDLMNDNYIEVLTDSQDDGQEVIINKNIDNAKKQYECNIYTTEGDKPKASVMYMGDEFYLLEDSTIMKPSKLMLEWKDGGLSYQRGIRDFNIQLERGTIEQVEGDTYKVISDIPFKTPSAAGYLVRGGPVNGWTYFDGLNEVRGQK